MEEEIKKLRDAGFSDADIRTYMDSQQSSSTTPTGPVNPAQVSDSSNIPRADETVPDYGATAAPSAGETAGTVAAAVAPYAGPAALSALGGGAAYGAYKFGSKVLDVGRGLGEQMAQRNVIEAGREARLANRPGFGGTPGAAPTAPAPTYNVPTGQPPQTRMPVPGTPPAPVAPAAPAAAPAAPNVMQRGMDYARQMQKIAAEKVVQGTRAVAPYAKTAGAGMAAALTPGNVGQNYNFPTSGKFAGMEINPMTGRPWTQQELAQYR